MNELLPDSENKSSSAPIIVVNNSPIEFILVGPRGKGEGILVRSEHAGLDLVGLCSDGQESRRMRPSPYSPLSILGANYLLDTSVVRTNPISVKQVIDDDRMATFTFSWSGMSEPREQELLRAEFDRHITDIQNAIAKGDRDQVEWSLGPLISLCLKTDKKHRFYRNVIRSILIVFTSVYLIFCAVR